MSDQPPTPPPATDPRPWRCIDCGDRFAREQITGNHRTELKPRPADAIRTRRKR